MLILMLGLLLFLGTHSVRIFADGWRTRQIARFGPTRWKGCYAGISAIGFILLIWGYSLARVEPVQLWLPPLWTRHVAAALTLPALILIAAAYVPGTRMRATIGHPMLAGVKLWALAHLLANGTLADAALFGSFLAWAVADFVVLRRRDRVAGVAAQPGTPLNDLIAASIGVAVWILISGYLHRVLFGVATFA
ncbi:MAG: NnrU family protein [Rhodocyclales bacterium]|nr:NnrU family protein [Rhodocyclales bacterium]